MSLSGGGTGAAATPASGPTPTASPAPDAGAGAAAAAANALAAAGLGMTGLGALPGAGDDLMQRVQAAEGQAQAVLVRCCLPVVPPQHSAALRPRLLAGAGLSPC